MRDEPPQLHDQQIWSGELRLTAEYGFEEGWSAEALFPVRALRTTIQYRNLEGEPITLDYENIHHRNETLIGPGDPTVAVRRGFNVERWLLAISGRAGVSLPLGFTVPDPFELGEQGEPHEHIQFGTGTFDPLLGVEVRRELRTPWRGAIEAFAQAQLPFYANRYGHTAGRRYTGGVQVAWKIDFTGPTVQLGALVFHEDAEQWATTPDPQEGNLGRTDILVSGSIVHSFGPDWVARFSFHFPVFVSAEGAQITYPGIGEIGASRLLHLHGPGMD